MKKIFLIGMLFITMIVLSLIHVSFATLNTDQATQEVKVVYGVDNTFIITIPEQLEIVGMKVSEEVISVSNVIIGYGKELNVTVNSANYDTTWNLVNTDETLKNKLPYSIGKTSGGDEIKNNSVVLNVPAGTVEGASQTLYFESQAVPEVAGIYTDTLNFVVNVSDM